MPLQTVFELLGMLDPAGNRGGKETVPPEESEEFDYWGGTCSGTSGGEGVRTVSSAPLP